MKKGTTSRHNNNKIKINKIIKSYSYNYNNHFIVQNHIMYIKKNMIRPMMIHMCEINFNKVPNLLLIMIKYHKCHHYVYYIHRRNYVHLFPMSLLHLLLLLLLLLPLPLLQLQLRKKCCTLVDVPTMQHIIMFIMSVMD